MDSTRLDRFCGLTRMTPPRGLSMSAMRENEMDKTSGRIRSRNASALASRARYPTNTLQQMAIATIRAHAAIGMRFHQAACVYPCEFNTSFMPDTAMATRGVGCAAAGAWTADHS